ncbi:MAG: hypothetical protein KJZ91_00080 [Myxococcales bacterium]|nr:hypothetical protein [Myxococcales bacterium]
MGAPAVEPRTSCPACGGPVHPIAGRCKHCKADLTRLRTAGPGGAARPRLVALGGGAAPAPVTPGAPAAAAAASTPRGAPPVHEPGAPDVAHADAPRASWSSRWPLLVAAVAVVAILISVGILVLGGDEPRRDGARRFDGPAPERTPTDPMTPRVAPVPPGGAPHAGGGGPAPAVPDDPGGDQIAPPPPPVPSAPRGGRVGPTSARAFAEQAVEVGCRRLTACVGSDPLIATYCAMASQMMPDDTTIDGVCPDYDGAAAQQCLDALAGFPCPAGGQLDPDAIARTLLSLTGCQRVCPGAFAGGLLSP